MTEKQEIIVEEVKRLKAELAELREFAYERAPKIAAEEANKQIERLKTENERMRAALWFIANLESGSRGAYSKFAEAQSRARHAIGQEAGTLRIKKGER
jgi:hypothetical protein